VVRQAEGAPANQLIKTLPKYMTIMVCVVMKIISNIELLYMLTCGRLQVTTMY